MRVDGQPGNRVNEIESSLVQQYGPAAQSAVDSVAEGIKTVIQKAPASWDSAPIGDNLIGNIFGGPIIGTLIGKAIGESAGCDSPDAAEPKEQRLGSDDLTAFNKNVFGIDGFRAFLTESPAMSALQRMETTLQKTLKLREDVVKLNWPIRV